MHDLEYDLEWLSHVKFCFRAGTSSVGDCDSRKSLYVKTKLPIIDPHCQQQKCSAEGLVSGSIRFVRIFALVPWRGGLDKKIWCSKWAFSISVWVSSISRELWPLLDGIAKAIRSIATAVTVAWSVCSSVTLMLSAKTVGRKEVRFGRDTRVVPGHIVLDRGAGPHWKGRCVDWIWIGTPSQNLHCKLRHCKLRPNRYR